MTSASSWTMPGRRHDAADTDAVELADDSDQAIVPRW
jgi:hypothetical protein